ncbi:MAG: hypothetical protein SNG38_09520 [Rikenellaceae bacterium]
MGKKVKYWSCFRLTIICLFLSVVAVGCGVTRTAQLPAIVDNQLYRNYPPLNSEQVDSLLLIYATNKIFVEEFLEPTLIALSHYPELKETKIEFKYSAEATTMAARPKPLSMLWRRRYIVLINDREEFGGIHLEDVPYNAQIGIIGHELAHIADYENHNLAGVMGILFRYADKKRKPLFEKEIDRATIERGLGWQLYDWAAFSLSDESGATEEYREFKRQHYLTPEQIEQYILFFSSFGVE